MRTKILRLDLDGALGDVVIERGYDDVLLIALFDGAVIGQFFAPLDSAREPGGDRTLLAADLRAILEDVLGGVLWKRRAEAAALHALGGRPTTGATPTVSVVVCTRDRPDDLARCLASLRDLETEPLEIIVVDNCPTDDRTRVVCGEHDVRYLREDVPGQSRARNRGIAAARGELIAFTDDDCVVDPRWLDDLGEPFSDPLVMVVTGYVGPLEIETRAQRLFEVHGGFQRRYERVVYDGAAGSPARMAGPAGAGANMIFRRSAFDLIDGFAEDLGPGTPACAADETYVFYGLLAHGRRIVFDPARIVWHRNRATMEELRKLLFEYGVAVSAYASRCLGRHSDADALAVLRWWWWHRIAKDFGRIVLRRWRRMPPAFVLAEVHGSVIGPWRLRRSVRSRRGIEPVSVGSSAGRALQPPVSVTEEAAAVSVLIPTRNRRERLRVALEALARQTHPADRIEVVIVLDRCTDGSLEMARSLDVPYRLALVEKHDDRGLATARNESALAASNPILAFIDDDIVPEPTFVAAHSAAHAGSDDLVALGPCPPVFDRETYLAAEIRSWWADHARRKAQPDYRWTYVDFVTGNSSLSSRLFSEAGGFDEDFSGRHEDWELGIRLLDRGARFTYRADASATHHTQGELGRHLRGQRAEGAADVLLARRHPRIYGRLPYAWRCRDIEAGTAGAPFPFRHPRVGELANVLGPRIAAVLERAGLRTAWQRLSWKLAGNAYWLGVRDLVADLDALAAGAEPAVEVDIDLDDPAPLGDSIPHTEAVDVRLIVSGVAVARVPVFAPHGQWDVPNLVQRIVSTMTYEEKTDPATAELLRAWRFGPAPAPTLR